ncbi:TrkA family potassium uptake protein [bacterium]|nr:TrkA family potassium uptake protein [bacterium]
MREILVVGAGEFGKNIAERFTQLGEKVTVIDLEEKRLINIRDKVSETYVMDVTDKNQLTEIDIDTCQMAVITIGENFSANLLGVFHLRQLGIPTIVARASNGIQKRILEKIGCNIVLFPEENIAKRLAEDVLFGDIERIKLNALESIVYSPVPKGAVGKKISELNLDKAGVELLFLQREYSKKKGEYTKYIPENESGTIIENGDYLVLMGNDKDIIRLLGNYKNVKE